MPLWSSLALSHAGGKIGDVPKAHTKVKRGLPTVVDLFAGCGGMTRGFVDAGFEPVLAVESDFAAASSYAANFCEEHVVCEPIEDVGAERLVDADVVVGGPPCQGFSNLGKRDTDDHRNGYWEYYVDVVASISPQVFVLENVDRFLKSGQYDDLVAETGKGGRLGDYTVEPYLLNAADYGVPQRRHRAIVIGTRVGEIGRPVGRFAKKPKDGQERWRSVRDAIGDLDRRPRTALPDSWDSYFDSDVQGTFKHLDIHVGRGYEPLSLERFALIPPGGSRINLPDRLLYDCWRNHHSGSKDVMGRLVWDEPAVTIRTEFFKPDKGRYLHPQWTRNPKQQVNRAITHLEAARLQSFPDDFLWCGSKIEIARQIGNAVPPLLAREIAGHILPRLE